MNRYQHQSVVKAEFGRRADKIVNAPSFTDEDTITHVLQAVAPQPEDRILDVACGTGVVAFRLGEVACEVVGLDVTGEMLQRARKRRHDSGMLNVHFELGEAEALPFPKASFDKAVCRMSIHHFDDPPRALAEMVRVVRPEGRVVVADITTSDDPQAARLHNAIECLRDPSHVRMLTKDELLDLVAGVGLQVQHVKSWKKGRTFDEWADVLNAPERTEPLRVVLEALAQSGRSAGINLHLNEQGQAVFEHSWLLISARKGD